MESFVTIVNGFSLPSIGAKLFLLDVFGSPSYASGFKLITSTSPTINVFEVVRLEIF